MKILTIVGARPQFIKAAAISRVIREKKDIKEIILHTGQHYDHNMSEIFFEEMDIPKPDYQLHVNGLSHGAMTGQMLEKIEEVIIKENPDWVLVYGDTNSTLAGALAASKLNIPVAHVEAGLRSFNMKMPEEINRILTDRISKVLFCPTENALKSLENEGYKNFPSQLVLSGDVMEDVALFYSDKVGDQSWPLENLEKGKPFVLATLHRAENTDDKARLSSIIEGLNKVHEVLLPVVLPLHPRTKKALVESEIRFNGIVIPPVSYLQMVLLLQYCKLVCTDSGGLQKEAYFFNKFCVTTRDETEWTELIENGFNTLVGANEGKIIFAIKELSEKIFQRNIELYGGGKAAQKIVGFLEEYKV